MTSSICGFSVTSVLCVFIAFRKLWTEGAEMLKYGNSLFNNQIKDKQEVDLSSDGELCNDAICTYLSKADLESYYGELMNISSNDYVESNNVIKVNSMLTTVNEENNSLGTNRKNEFVSQQITNLINIETYSSMSKLKVKC